MRLACRLQSTLIATMLVLAAPFAVRAEAVRYELDPVHTRVQFAVSHAGFSSAIGAVSGSTGELWFDADDWTSARLRAHVPMTRVDLGDAKWNAATLAPRLLDAEDHPIASFVSTRIEPLDAQRAAVFGTLTLRGVSQQVKLDVTLNAAKRHPLPPFRRTVGFSATTTISRKAFGIDAWPSVIGDTVELRIEAEATRARGRGGRGRESEGDGTGLPSTNETSDPSSNASSPSTPGDVGMPSSGMPASNMPAPDERVPGEPAPAPFPSATPGDDTP